MPRSWKYSQICCDVALAGIELGNWTCELCQESCILHSDYPLYGVNQTLYFVIFLSFVHRILTHANEEYETLMALQTSWRLQRKTRHASTLFSNQPPERKFQIWLQKKEILYRLCICSCNIWQWSSVWEKKSIVILRFFPFKIWQWSSVGEKKNTCIFILRKDKSDDQCVLLHCSLCHSQNNITKSALTVTLVVQNLAYSDLQV